MRTWVEQKLMRAQQDQAWINMQLSLKLSAEEAFLKILSNRAHKNKHSNHETIISIAHQVGLC